jgi:hypothetical protein
METWLCQDFYQDCQDKLRLLRLFKIVKIYQDLSRFIKIYQHFLRDFTNRHLWIDVTFHRCLLGNWIKSSNLDWDLWKFKLLLDWDQEIIKIFCKSQSRSRLLGLDIEAETKSRYLVVETSFLKVSRFSGLLRPALCQCLDRESRSRHDRDKSTVGQFNVDLWTKSKMIDGPLPDFGDPLNI